MVKKSRSEPPLSSPVPLAGPQARRAEALFRDRVDDHRRALGLSRRAFVESAAGTATALLVLQQVGCSGDVEATDGGGYAVDAGATQDAAPICGALSDAFVFDAQTHHVDADGAWRARDSRWQQFLSEQLGSQCGEPDFVDCFGRSSYVREVFVNSDTHVACLSALPADAGADPMDTAQQKATRDLVEQLARSQRLVIQGVVQPERGRGAIDTMRRQRDEQGVAAWKVCPAWGRWRLDDGNGQAFLRRAAELERPVVCVHKGVPLPGMDPAFTSPEDIGPAAAGHRGIRFLVDHAGFDPAYREGPYDPAGRGVDRLIRSCREHAIGADDNVWAELGSAWLHVMHDPVAAQHLVGKLLKYLGPDRVLWGTDSIWHGCPQGQIEAFRAFAISPALQQRHGYPALTADVKAKILGLNAAAVYGIDVAARRCAIDGDAIARHKRRRATRIAAPSYAPSRRALFDWLRGRGYARS